MPKKTTKSSFKTAKRPQKSKKQNKPQRRSLRFWIILVAVVVIGSIIVYAQAATDRKAEFIAKGDISISYVDEKPGVVGRDSAGKETSVARARTIDVSKSGTLYCTPEDSGPITQRQLPTADQATIDNLIRRAKAEPLPADIRNGNTTTLVNDYKGIFIRDLGVVENTKVYSPGLESPLFNETVAFLEGLCAVPATTIPDKDLPQWDIVVPGATPATSLAPKGIVQKIAQVVSPKVSAAGAATEEGSVNYYKLDVAHENYQVATFLQYRTSSGRSSLVRVECLNAAAREWAKTMAAAQDLRHSSPLSQLPVRYCGDTWMKIGENVGMTGVALNPTPADTKRSAESVMKAYWESPGHKRNILDPAWTSFGLGSWKTADGNRIYTAHMFWQGQIKK